MPSPQDTVTAQTDFYFLCVGADRFWGLREEI